MSSFTERQTEDSFLSAFHFQSDHDWLSESFLHREKWLQPFFHKNDLHRITSDSFVSGALISCPLLWTGHSILYAWELGVTVLLISSVITSDDDLSTMLVMRHEIPLLVMIFDRGDDYKNFLEKANLLWWHCSLWSCCSPWWSSW